MNETWRIARVGNEFFRSHLNDLGHLTMRLPVPREGTLTWPEICERAGFRSDLVVYADVSRPPALVGVEDFPCLTAFYCIDSHLHA